MGMLGRSRRHALCALLALAFACCTIGHAAGWSPAGSQIVPRTNHSATVLPNGRVLIAGGTSGTASETYDPVTATSRPTGPIIGPRLLHTATLLRNGKVLVAGGTSGSVALGTAELYDPAAGTFTATGALITPRQAAVATLLLDGRVLIVGGYNASGVIASAELYDPATGLFSATGGLVAGRRRTTATLLVDGRVLVAGGFDSATNHYLASAEIYDPATGAFTSAASLNTARGLATATLLPSGKVLLAAGSSDSGDLRSAELYDPAANMWTFTGSLSATRDTASAALLPNGRVLIVSGAASPSTYVPSAEIYDPASGTFTAAGKLTHPRSAAASVVVPGGQVLITGGNTASGSSASIERYDPAAPTFTASGSLQQNHFQNTAVNLPDGRVVFIDVVSELYTPATGAFTGAIYSSALHQGGSTSTMLADGRVLVVGGIFSTNSTVTRNTADLFSSQGAVFLKTATTVAPRYYATSTLLADGRVLIAGGVDYSASGSPLVASAEIFDPATDTFHATGSMLTARDRATATLLPNGKVLIAGGEHAAYSATNAAELYDPATGTFSATGSLAVARYSATATLLREGKVLVAGGVTGGGSVEIYDPASGTFTTANSMASPRALATATLLPSGKVLIAGGHNTLDASTLSDTEIYDPATGAFSAGGNLTTPRESHTANLLDDGRVLIAGGYIPSPQTYIRSSEIYDPSIGFDDAKRPVLSTIALSASSPPASLAIGGTGFRGTLRQDAVSASIGSEGGSGSNQGSASNVPLLYVERMDNSQGWFVAPDPSLPWTDTMLQTSVLSGLPLGLYRATIYVGGVPSRSRVFALGTASGVQLSGGGVTRVDQPFVPSMLAVVTDANDNTIAGAPVNFSVAPVTNGASATLSAPSGISDAAGRISITLTANAKAGVFLLYAAPNAVQSNSLYMRNVPGPPASTTILEGNPQNTLVHTAFAQPLKVKVQDSDGNVIDHTLVTFTAPAGGANATLSAASVYTDAAGTASIMATAGGVAGQYNVYAKAGTVDVVPFVLTNLRGPAAILAAHNGPAFTGTAGTPLAIPPSVIVTDLDGNPVPGVQVDFSTSGTSSGSITGDGPISGADGIATLGSWTLDSTPGTNTVQATAGTLAGSPVTFTAQGTSNVDVGVNMTTNGSGYVQYGHTLDYVIVVSASGPADATDVRVSDSLSPLLDPSSAHWICIPAQTASCDAGGSGVPSGAHASIPTGSSVTFVVSAKVVGAPDSESIANTASAITTGDTNPGNDSMSLQTQAVIFRNGFEPGGNGAN
jgi:uncharacterized repeat protein (TIGR01451 family)